MRVYIGYDSKQSSASKVCEYSIKKHTTSDVDIIHLDTNKLKEDKIYFRPEGDPSSTEFTYSRFLVPFLDDYKGYSIFVDSDFLFLEDINKLFNLALNDFGKTKRAAYCVKHLEYTPKSDTKFYGKPQLTFPKKNWSSLVIFNNEHPSCKNLSPMTVANKSPQWLHRFQWLNEHDEELGNIPITWNWLVGEYSSKVNPHALHFTNGGPFNEVYGQDYEDIWNEYLNESMTDSSK